MKKAVVIGAGLGGLAAAITMQSRGIDVTVVDENHHAGGKMMSVDEGGYHFDFGPNTITMPHVFSRVIRQAGEDPARYLSFQKLTHHTKNTFADGSVLWQSADHADMSRELDRFGPHHYDEYRKEVERLYDLAERYFFSRTFQSARDYRSLPLLGALLSVRPFESMAHFHGRFFKDVRVQQVFNRYATYIGSSPYRAAATFAMIGHLEMNEGVYYVKGGNVRIAKTFQEVFQKQGGTIVLGERAVRVLVENRRAAGVELASGEKLTADFVVVNGDFVTATEALFDERDRPSLPNRKLNRYEPSISAFVVMAGVKKRLDLPHHSVLFSADYKREFQQIFTDKQLPDDPTIYISHSAASDPDVTKGSNLFMLVNAPARDVEVDRYKAFLYEELARRGVDIGTPAVERVMAPQHIASRFSAFKGALYGISAHQMKDAFLRPRNHHPDIENVYYAGGTTHPGGGSPMVTISGLNVPFSG